MMKAETIKIERGIKYLSECEFLNDTDGTSPNTCRLPENKLFDKGKVGCGGSSIAIENNYPYVIAMPSREVIENKMKQYPMKGRYEHPLFDFKGKKSIEALNVYIAKAEKQDFPAKILTAYESFGELHKWLDDPSCYSLLIDELHILFTNYSFRDEGVRPILSLYDQYHEFCFMTATVVEEEFMLEELKHIPLVEAVWEDARVATVKSKKCDKNIKGVVAGLIDDYLTGVIDGNAYIFVNSVSFIRALVKGCKLNKTNTRVIYSKSNKQTVGIKNGNTFDNPKKINFLTSTCFEGADIFDPIGRLIVVSDSASPYSLVDISTSFQQIGGRIRNTKYWDEILHIYTNTRYTEIGYEEFKENSVKEIATTKNKVARMNKVDLDIRQIMDLTNDAYIRGVGDDFIFDPNKVKVDLYNHKLTSQVYKVRVNTPNIVGLSEEYTKNGYTEVSVKTSYQVKAIDKLGETFRETVETIEGLAEDGETYQAALYKYKFLEEAIKHFGFSGIEDLKYNQTNIKTKLKNLLDVSDGTKVFLALKEQVVLGDFISSSSLKSKIANIYKHLDISRTAKASDIISFFNVRNDKVTTVRVKGVKTNGYILMSAKAVFIPFK